MLKIGEQELILFHQQSNKWNPKKLAELSGGPRNGTPSRIPIMIAKAELNFKLEICQVFGRKNNDSLPSNEDCNIFEIFQNVPVNSLKIHWLLPPNLPE